LKATYKTVQNDCWDIIAQRCLGSTSATGELMRINAKYVSHYTYFPAGIVLQLPVVTRKSQSDTLPPWKRETV